MVFGGLLGGVGGGIGGLIGYATAGEGGEDEFKEAVNIWRQIQTPDFDFRTLSPPQLAVFAEFFPETYEAVVPDQVKTAMDSPEVRAQIAGAVGQFEQMRQEGLPLSQRLAAEQAQRAVVGGTRQRQAALRSELAQRGRLGGGTEAALRAQAGQVGANLARDLGADLTQQAIQNQILGGQLTAQLGGQLRGQDISLSGQQAEAINRFNEMVSRLRTRAAQEAAGSRERAGFAQAGLQQRVGETQALADYQTQLENLERQNQLRQHQYEAELARAKGLTGQLGQLGGFEETRRAERIRLGQQVGQGLGQGIGGVADIYGGAGGFGAGVQGLYR